MRPALRAYVERDTRRARGKLEDATLAVGVDANLVTVAGVDDDLAGDELQVHGPVLRDRDGGVELRCRPGLGPIVAIVLSPGGCSDRGTGALQYGKRDESACEFHVHIL
jgi:hypothetical protein